MVEFLVGVVTGLSLAGLIWIVVGPSRRIRAEGGLDRDTETRLLLGLDPEAEPAAEAESGSGDPHHFDAAELQALRRLGQTRRGRR